MPKLKYIRQHVFSILSVFTIGFPFVGYKILGGVLIHNIYGGFFAAVIALVFIVWGLIDLVLNAVCLYAISWRGNTDYPVCLLSIITRKHKVLSGWKDAGEALDVMLSFSIVAAVVGNALFPYMDGGQVKVWNLCTVINVLGAGIAKIGTTLADAAASAENKNQAIDNPPA